MLRVSSPLIVPSSKIDGSFPSWPEVIFQPRDTRALCDLFWLKPDIALGLICDVSDRASREYLNGNVPLPSIALAAINLAITKR